MSGGLRPQSCARIMRKRSRHQRCKRQNGRVIQIKVICGFPITEHVCYLMKRVIFMCHNNTRSNIALTSGHASSAVRERSREIESAMIMASSRIVKVSTTGAAGMVTGSFGFRSFLTTTASPASALATISSRCSGSIFARASIAPRSSN
jgi:hypothetical protein